MKIVCTENEEEWIKKLLAESDDCALNKNHCELLAPTNIKAICMKCIEKNVEFEREDTKWIPCSERLPEEGKQVLVSGYNTYGKEVTIASYQGEQYGWTCGLVSAWQPLPSPYEKEIKIS